MNTQIPQAGKPKAYVNWILFDEQFNYVQSSSGAEQVGADNTLTNHIKQDLPVNKNGYLYVYVSNETPNMDVFFDNLQVTHVRGPLLEESHYYPFGLTMAGISSKSAGKLQNKDKTFQGQRWDNDLDVNYYSFKWRNHDAQIGRFIQIDPLSDKYVYNSTYAFSENKVTSHVELEGLESVSLSTDDLWRDAGISSSSDPKEFVKNVGKEAAKPSTWLEAGAAVGQMVGGVLLGLLTEGILSGTTIAAETNALRTAPKFNLSAPLETVEVEGVNLTVKAKPTWNAGQIAQAEAKAEALTNAETIVTKNPVVRDANLRSKFIKAGGQVGATEHVDHIVDLQLGGTNKMNNLQALDKSVNTSFGKQIQLQIQNLPDNTKVNKVILQYPLKN